MKNILFLILALMVTGSLCASNKGKLSDLRNRTAAGLKSTNPRGQLKPNHAQSLVQKDQFTSTTSTLRQELHRGEQEADAAATCCGVSFVGCLAVTACCVWRALKS